MRVLEFTPPGGMETNTCPPTCYGYQGGNARGEETEIVGLVKGERRWRSRRKVNIYCLPCPIIIPPTKLQDSPCYCANYRYHLSYV